MQLYPGNLGTSHPGLSGNISTHPVARKHIRKCVAVRRLPVSLDTDRMTQICQIDSMVMSPFDALSVSLSFVCILNLNVKLT